MLLSYGSTNNKGVIIGVRPGESLERVGSKSEDFPHEQSQVSLLWIQSQNGKGNFATP